MNPLFLIDFYKVGHVSQYPNDTQYVWSNWTPRYSRVGCKSPVFFGLQYFIKKYLHAWEKDFFLRPLKSVLDEYREVISATLHVENPRTDHIERLHAHGYLPIDIWAIPEGRTVDLRVPVFVIKNNTPDTFWAPNYLETILSNVLWKPCTSATTARAYRKLFKKYALEAGERDFGFIDWQGHDFSFRGMSGLEDACISGMGHLLSFSGTDTLPAILTAKQYYDASLSCGGSVNATEHSVMCAHEQDCELEAFRRLITEVHPEGILSIVSDTWDLWKVLTEYVPKLHDVLEARNGKIVIRPDSGNPVDILCGDWSAPFDHPARKGVLRLLAEVMGTEPGGGNLPMIRKMGAIYGDSITLERADEILRRTVRDLKLSPYNLVLGIGSFTYEYVTRDTHGYAMKATAVNRGGKVIDIFKKPVTDNGDKNSLKGIPAVYRTEESTDDRPRFFVTDGNKPEALENCEFQRVFSDGVLLIDEKFETIRERVRA